MAKKVSFKKTLAYQLLTNRYFIATVSLLVWLAFFDRNDFLTTYSANLRSQGEYIQEEAIQYMRERYGFQQPVYVQYGKWVWGIITRGDWGQSMEWQMPVKDQIGRAHV